MHKLQGKLRRALSLYHFDLSLSATGRTKLFTRPPAKITITLTQVSEMTIDIHPSETPRIILKNRQEMEPHQILSGVQICWK